MAERGLGAVYLEHVRRLADPLLAEGRQVQIWADVLRHHPEVAGDLPEGVVPIAWCYEAPPAGGGVPDLPRGVLDVLASLGSGPDAFAGFGPNLAPLLDAGVAPWVAAGTSAWSSLVGRVDNARANLVDAAEAARAHGLGGYLVTDWGDGGHHQPPSVSFGPLVLGGALAWGLDANRDVDLDAVLSHHVLGDATGRLARALDALGRQWARTGQTALNGSPLSAALLPSEPHLVFGHPDPDRLAEVVAAIEGALADVAGAEPTCADARLVTAEVAQAARLARHGAWRLLGEAGPPAAAMADDMAELVEGQLTTWLDRARPGGLRTSLERLDPLFASSVPMAPDEIDLRSW